MWIAFNLITFVDITQHLNGATLFDNCCELLSIWLLLWISHSISHKSFPWVLVVNCFQFDYFCGYHTALYCKDYLTSGLWIAFNLITFVDITQQHYKRPPKYPSCELLSIWLLLWISHSFSEQRNKLEDVVNCFQFDYFCGYHTAIFVFTLFPLLLWIAFNLITFVDITQLLEPITLNIISCELLSIWLLLWISHSLFPWLLYKGFVVNCFQFDYFCGYHTALILTGITEYPLWIAFNLITFEDITQLE